jgi:hypothetical protein
VSEVSTVGLDHGEGTGANEVTPQAPEDDQDDAPDTEEDDDDVADTEEDDDDAADTEGDDHDTAGVTGLQR